MQFTEEDIRHIVEDVWSVMLGLPLGTSEDQTPGFWDDCVTGCVHIHGDWNGAVVIGCPTPLARVATELLFEAEEGQEMEVEDIRDAFGELTNIVGGNIKALIEGECDLSLPVVLQGGGYTLMVPGSEAISHLGFLCIGENLRLLVVEKNNNAQAARPRRRKHRAACERGQR